MPSLQVQSRKSYPVYELGLCSKPGCQRGEGGLPQVALGVGSYKYIDTQFCVYRIIMQFYNCAYLYNYIINIYELGVNILNVGILLKRREDWMLKSIKQSVDTSVRKAHRFGGAGTAFPPA